MCGCGDSLKLVPVNLVLWLERQLPMQSSSQGIYRKSIWRRICCIIKLFVDLEKAFDRIQKKKMVGHTKQGTREAVKVGNSNI